MPVATIDTRELLRPGVEVFESTHSSSFGGLLSGFGIQATESVCSRALLRLRLPQDEDGRGPYDISTAGIPNSPPSVDIVLAGKGEAGLEIHPTDDDAIRTGFRLTDAGIIVVAELDLAGFTTPTLRGPSIKKMAKTIGGLVATQNVPYSSADRVVKSRQSSYVLAAVSGLSVLSTGLHLIAMQPVNAVLTTITSVAMGVASTRQYDNSVMLEAEIAPTGEEAVALGGEVTRRLDLAYYGPLNVNRSIVHDA